MEVAEIGAFSDPINLAKTKVLCERLVFRRTERGSEVICKTPNKANFSVIFAVASGDGGFCTTPLLAGELRQN